MCKKIILAILFALINLFIQAQPSLQLLDSPLKVKMIWPPSYYGHPYTPIEVNTLNVTKGYHNEGYSALLIDKKVAARSEEAFDFLHINLSTKAITRIPVIIGNNTNLPQTKIGEIRTIKWGYADKLYVTTVEPTHLVSFDAYNNIAHDYGNPFKNNVNYCNAMSIGLDSAVYGVSVNTNGYIYTFRLDPKTDEIQVDSIYDANASMGIAVQADSVYTYIITGREGSSVYSINRETHEHYGPLLFSNTAATNALTGIETYPRTLSFGFPPAGETAFYKFLNGGVIQLSNRLLPVYPFDNEIYPAQVSADSISYPLIGYNEVTDSVFWKFRNSNVEDGVKISPKLTVSHTETIQNYSNNKLIGWGNVYSNFFNFNYSNNTYVPSISTSSIYSSFVKNNKLYYCGYPGGKIQIFNPDLPVNILRNTFLSSPVNESDPIANPRRFGSILIKSKSPQVVNAILPINDTTIAFGGDINSDCRRLGDGGGIGYTTSSGRTVIISDSSLLSIVPNSGVLGDNKFPYYSTRTYTCENIDPEIKASIIKQDVFGNKIEKKIPFFTKDAGILAKGIENQIIGYTQNIVYFISEITDDIYKVIPMENYVVLDAHLGYDNNIWILTKDLTGVYNFFKMNPYNGDYSSKISFTGSEQQTYTKFIFIGGDVYISGGLQLAKIANLASPVTNSYLSNYEKMNGIFNFILCN